MSALAGNSVPVVCGGLEWNDGLVTVKSAHYGISDVGQTNDLHHQLTDAKSFGNFVKPHLVTGPSKTYPIPVKNDPTDWRRWQVDNSSTGGPSPAGSAQNLLGPAVDRFADAVFDTNFPAARGPNASEIEP